MGDDIALMQVDQATAHTANGILWPSNSFPTFQPPHCPELNPIERFWLLLKKQLAWQNCPTLEALRQLLSAKLEACKFSQTSAGDSHSTSAPRSRKLRHLILS